MLRLEQERRKKKLNKMHADTRTKRLQKRDARWFGFFLLWERHIFLSSRYHTKDDLFTLFFTCLFIPIWVLLQFFFFLCVHISSPFASFHSICKETFCSNVFGYFFLSLSLYVYKNIGFRRKTCTITHWKYFELNTVNGKEIKRMKWFCFRCIFYYFFFFFECCSKRS